MTFNYMTKKTNKNPNKSKIKKSVLLEEIFNSITHGIGVLLSIAALVLLVVK